MFEAYWKLSGKPFAYRTPLADCYPVQSQQAALLRLQYCIENGAGCALLLGESGLGKSTLLKMLESEHDNLRPFVRLAFPGLAAVEQLRLITSHLADSESPGCNGSDQRLLAIYNGLLQYAAGDACHPVICFDDAQLLPPQVLTDVVLPLLNLRDFDDRLDFTVVLAGQPVLGSQLARQPQLRERTAVTAKLSGMTLEETYDYVQSRLEACGSAAEIFTDTAIQRLHEVSHGNPRRLNRLCDMALLVGCAEELERITEREIESVGTELLTAA